MLNGSPRKDGNTAIALKEEMEKIFQAEGIDVETVQVGNQAVRGCISCYSCKKNGKCIFDDQVNQGDSLVIYYAPNSWNFTRLGKISGISESELRELLGDGDVTVTLSLEQQ